MKTTNEKKKKTKIPAGFWRTRSGNIALKAIIEYKKLEKAEASETEDMMVEAGLKKKAASKIPKLIQRIVNALTVEDALTLDKLVNCVNEGLKAEGLDVRASQQQVQCALNMRLLESKKPNDETGKFKITHKQARVIDDGEGNYSRNPDYEEEETETSHPVLKKAAGAALKKGAKASV